MAFELRPRTIAKSLGAIAGVLILFFGLLLISSRPQFGSAEPPPPAAEAAGQGQSLALCGEPIDEAAKSLETKFHAHAADAGAEVKAVTFGSSPAKGAPVGYDARELDLTIAGSEDAVTRMTEALAAEALPVFVMGMDVAPAASGVTATFHGVLMCLAAP